MCRSRGGGWGGGAGGPDPPPPLKNHKDIGFLSQTDPDPLKNHKKAANPAFIGTPVKRYLNGDSLEADDGPKHVVLKKTSKLDPL